MIDYSIFCICVQLEFLTLYSGPQVLPFNRIELSSKVMASPSISSWVMSLLKVSMLWLSLMEISVM